MVKRISNNVISLDKQKQFYFFEVILLLVKAYIWIIVQWYSSEQTKFVTTFVFLYFDIIYITTYWKKEKKFNSFKSAN